MIATSHDQNSNSNLNPNRLELVAYCSAAAGAHLPGQPARVRAARGAQGARGRRVQDARVRRARQAQPRAAVLEQLPPAAAASPGRSRHRRAGGDPSAAAVGCRPGDRGTRVQAGDGRGAQALRAHGHARRVLGQGRENVRRRQARGEREEGGAGDRGCRRHESWGPDGRRDQTEEWRGRDIGGRRRVPAVRAAQAASRPAGLRPVRRLFCAAVQAEVEAYDVGECCCRLFCAAVKAEIEAYDVAKYCCRQEEKFVNKKTPVAAVLCFRRSESCAVQLEDAQ